MPISSENNKRIAKNTVLLYFRTLITMAISLYTSRVILEQLGVSDYGIYNVVGGMVAMFSVISSALSASISRFITFEIGKDDKSRTQAIFSTSVNIQFFIAAVVLVLGEIVGVWFLNFQMSIPEGRLYAANWVLQCSLVAFCVNLISVPYNSCIIAHEHMTAFAYVGILEAVLRLAICFMLIFSPIDKLIFYAILMLAVAIIIRIIYGVYCSHNFEECKYHFVYDKKLLKEMTGFAGWSFFTNVAWVFNTQGVSLLVNVFFGVTVNAARGIASQVEGAVTQFVNSFTTAISPQITKSYAAGDRPQMFSLICRGAKFSYLLLLFFVMPIIIETPYILKLWLKTVPDFSVIFVRLTLIGTAINILGNSCYTACMATGDIKRYVLWVTFAGLLVFPLTWITYAIGFPAYATYIIYAIVYIGVDAIRIYIMRGLLQFPAMMFVKQVLVPVTTTTVVASVLPVLIPLHMEPSFIRLLVTCTVTTISIGISVYYLGLTKHEREMIIGKVLTRIKNK